MSIVQRVNLIAFALSIIACTAGSSGTNVSDAGAAADDAAQAFDAPSQARDAGHPKKDSNGCFIDPGPPASSLDLSGTADPIAGGASKFDLSAALRGFEASGKLTAVITTEKSAIRCVLLENEAPISVANFVGLARGTRPFKKSGTWQLGRFYDGLTWHRVIPDFVIQGGDPLGTGSGGPGYSLPKENNVDEPKGTLAMAASSQVSGSQFYIVVGTGPAANYNVFGTCTTDVAEQIAAVPRDSKDVPTDPVHMSRIDIVRCP